MPLDSHADPRLTKSGGMSFDVWVYILRLEMRAHGNPTGALDALDWHDYYDDDHMPHDAIEEDFNAAGDDGYEPSSDGLETWTK